MKGAKRSVAATSKAQKHESAKLEDATAGSSSSDDEDQRRRWSKAQRTEPAETGSTAQPSAAADRATARTEKADALLENLTAKLERTTDPVKRLALQARRQGAEPVAAWPCSFIHSAT